MTTALFVVLLLVVMIPFVVFRSMLDRYYADVTKRVFRSWRHMWPSARRR